MELKYNSISAKVYRNFYETSKMPKSLCPYFWKLVAAWPLTILFSPLLFPFWIVDKLDRGDNDRAPFPAQVFLGILIYFAIFCVFCIGVTVSSIWITYYRGTLWFKWYVGGFVVIFISLVGGIVFLISELKERRKQKRRAAQYDENGNYLPSEEKPNLIVEFIKAKYKKYCPKIDWNYDEKI
jgi:hypothetical protein